MAATFLWQSTTGGDFDAPGNWQLSSGSSSLGYPGAADTAVFGGTVGGTILTSTAAQVDTLDLTAAAWVLSGQITANTVNISNGSALGLSASGQLVANNVLLVSSGTVNVIAGTLAVAGTATPTVFGTGGTGALNVTNHGIASFSGALTIGTAGSGSADVDAGVLTVGGLLQLGSGVAGSNGALYVADSGSVFLTSASDSSKSYLQLGAISGTAGFVQVSGAESLLSVTSNSGQVGGSGSGALNVLNGGTANFRSTNNGLDPALNVGVLAGGAGAILVSGGGSTLGVNGSIRVGVSGRGTLQVTGGGSVTSAGFTATQAALAVAAGLGGSGSVTIDGAGSQLAANGTVVVGGDNRGSGLVLGGIGTISVTNGGFLQSGTMTIAAGSTVGVDAASQDDVSGDLNVAGTLTNVGTLIVSGTLSGAGTLQLAGGFASVGSLSSASVGFVGPNATLRVSALTGTSTISGIQYGDRIDLAGDSTVRLTNNTVITTAGSLTLAGAPADTQYELTSDGSGGTFIGISADTVGVYRFFDSDYGTHFFTGSVTEANQIMQTRSDLVYEGIGLQAVDPNSADPNASPVYRFFDSTYGTHFFTASTAERDTVIATRSDLVYEGVGFLEHTTQEGGDVPVYRFFDTAYGTHFYTDDPNERATILATRPDLVDEGIGFYAPPTS